jgi:DnaD/phage-associated family protein
MIKTMSKISLSRARSDSDVLVSSGFLNQYMPSANGEYVKIYLYLLQIFQSGGELSFSSMADIFEMTEKDVLRALKYWSGKGVLELTYEDKAISQIRLLSPWEDSKCSSAEAHISPKDTPAAGQSDAAPVPPAASAPEKVPVPAPQPVPAAASAPVPDPISAYVLTPAMIQEAEGSDGFRNLLNLVQIYFKQTLNGIDYEKLIWIYFQLGQDFDACEVLVEYCAGKPKRGSRMRQLEQLTCSCIEQGFLSSKAIRSYLAHTDHCQLIKKALAVPTKDLTANQECYVRRWFEEYGFDEALVSEACVRSEKCENIKDRFTYANTILSDWYDKKVHTMEQVAIQDAIHREENPYPKKSSTKKSPPSGNKFNNFDQRDIDFTEMEAMVFGYDQNQDHTGD